MNIERLERMALAAWADWSCEADNTTENAAKFLDALKFKFDDLSEGGITHEVLNPYDDYIILNSISHQTSANQ